MLLCLPASSFWLCFTTFLCHETSNFECLPQSLALFPGGSFLSPSPFHPLALLSRTISSCVRLRVNIFLCSFVSIVSGLHRFISFDPKRHRVARTLSAPHQGFSLLGLLSSPCHALPHARCTNFSTSVCNLSLPPWTLTCSWHVDLFAVSSTPHATVFARSRTALPCGAS